MVFKYEGFDKTGKKIKGKVESDNIENAKEKLKDLYLTDIKPIKKINFDISFSKVPKKELIKTFNTLGLYLKSSIPLVSALNLTKNQSENQKIIKFLDFLQKSVKEGKSLHSSLELQKIIKLPKYITNTIKVGEESGKLDIVLIEIAKFLKDEDKLTSKTSQALIYPFFIIIVAIFTVSFMLTAVVPKIVKVFENLHQDLPTITKIVISSGNFIKNNFLLIILFITIISLIFYLFYIKNYKFKLYIHKLLLKLPIIKNIIIAKELGRFSYLTSTLVNSGVNYINAVNLAVNTIQNEAIKEKFEKALNDVVEGKKLSISLKKAGFDYDISFLQAIALAEETSQIDVVLKNLSEIYFEDNEARINTLLSLIEPTLIIIVGGTIGFIVAAMLLPMFSMSIIK
ncbi:type II secretion system F family protein [Nautilia lithotrophica]